MGASLWVVGVVDLPAVADHRVLVVRRADVGAVAQTHVVRRVEVGVAADAEHAAGVRDGHPDGRRPSTVALHHQAEVGLDAHEVAVVRDGDAGIGNVRHDAFSVHLATATTGDVTNRRD